MNPSSLNTEQINNVKSKLQSIILEQSQKIIFCKQDEGRSKVSENRKMLG